MTSYDNPKYVPLWHRRRVDQPAERQLRRWRRLAEKLAKLRGARWACGLCKRPIGDEAKRRGSYGRLLVRTPQGFRSRWRVRKLCYSCWVMVCAQIDRWEAQLANDHLPAEVLGRVDDHLSVERGYGRPRKIDE